MGRSVSAPARSDVQPDERLAGAWNARHKDDGFASRSLGVLDDRLDTFGRDPEVLRVRVVPSVVSLKKSCTSVAVPVRCAHAEETPSQAADADGG